MFNIQEYAVKIRRELHQYPEIGYDLDKTLAVVRRELDAIGIAYTEKFGKSSIVATLCPQNTDFTIGIRGDMDALPIQEQTDLPFASKTPNCMHACGHDMHTACLLATAKKLKEMEADLTCCVKFLFTPAEEYIKPGCEMMAKNGVMDDIDCIISLHADPSRPVGTVAIDAGGQGANSMGITVEFFGTTAHAASQQKGKDAIGMAVEAYQAMHTMVAREFSPSEPRLLNVGSIQGGYTNNIVCDYCKMFCSCRSHSDEVSEKLLNRIREIAQGVATMHSGRAEVTVNKYLPFVINHEVVTKKVYDAAAKVVGQENISHKARTLGGEDFSFLCRKKPGMQFWLGTRNENPCSALPLHNNKIIFDENAFTPGVNILVQFVLDNMHGIDF